ncbi:MAG: hypothetical protein ABI231_07655 [Candidatus Tumulicola sp.]
MATARPAFADQQYDVRGDDAYRVGSPAMVSRVEYAGTQRLSVERHGHHTRYDAQASYVRDAGDGKTRLHARFVQEILPNGSFEDRFDEDPDFLTILNQPFAIQLDAVTIRDLRGLRHAVPFDATSPLGGDAVLRGYLRPGTAGAIAGRAATAVRFEADGPMTAPMPARTNATISGRMRMDGTAYYSLDDAMLLALDATLTIVAQLHEGSKTTPVRIVYRRFIRATAPAGRSTPRTPRPTPLPTGAGTVSPATP